MSPLDLLFWGAIGIIVLIIVTILLLDSSEED